MKTLERKTQWSITVYLGKMKKKKKKNWSLFLVRGKGEKR